LILLRQVVVFCLKEGDRYEWLVAFNGWQLKKICKKDGVYAAKELIGAHYFCQSHVNVE